MKSQKHQTPTNHKLIFPLCLGLLLLIPYWLGAQTDDKNRVLAQQYFNNGDFEKAASLYEDLWAHDPDNLGYYNNLFSSYVQLKDWEDAEKTARKQSRKNGGIPAIDLMYVYQQKGDKAAADKLGNDILKSLPPSEEIIVAYSERFGKYGMDEMAVKTLEKGNKLLGNHVFSFELAKHYESAHETDLAVKEMGDFLENYPSEQERLKTYLQKTQDAKLSDALETEMIGRIQNHAERTDYVDFLVWMYVQAKDFSSALIQLKALDKRLNLDGRAIVYLAADARDVGMLNDAIRCYQYVIDKGTGPYYMMARGMLLKTRKQLIEESANPDPAEVLALKKDYESLIKEAPSKASVASTIVELSQLHAFYLDQLDTAIAELEDLVAQPAMKKSDLSQAKLQLGDYYTMNGDVFEANLTYGQVDKSEKDSPLGEDARFRNAKLSYYRGDYEWAKAQLNILKEATTELIANDALELGVFLQDNLGVDSVYQPLQLFSKAELLIFQRKDAEAMKKLDSIESLFPGHQLADDILMAKAKMYERQKNWTKEEDALHAIVNNYGDGILADNAMYMLAQLYEKSLNDPKKAMDMYQELLMKHKDSVFCTEARKRFRALRGDKDDYDDLFFDGTENGLKGN